MGTVRYGDLVPQAPIAGLGRIIRHPLSLSFNLPG